MNNSSLFLLIDTPQIKTKGKTLLPLGRLTHLSMKNIQYTLLNEKVYIYYLDYLGCYYSACLHLNKLYTYMYT